MHRPLRRTLTAAALAVLTVAVSACSDAQQAPRTLTVAAAASLRPSFEQIERDYEAAHPDVDVQLTTGGSSTLVSQLASGAPADVLATADRRTMDSAVQQGLLDGQPQVVARNVLAIAVPPGDPAGVGGLEDLERVDSLVVCAPQVPCGAAAQDLARQAGVRLQPVSEESSAADVLTKVTTGQAQAGLVYRTDVQAAGDQAELVPIEGAQEHPVPDLLAVTAQAAQDPQRARDARAFTALVRSDQGQRVLERHGFLGP